MKRIISVLKTTKNTLFPDNTTKLITPSNARVALEDYADSLLPRYDRFTVDVSIASPILDWESGIRAVMVGSAPIAANKTFASPVNVAIAIDGCFFFTIYSTADYLIFLEYFYDSPHFHIVSDTTLVAHGCICFFYSD